MKRYEVGESILAVVGRYRPIASHPRVTLQPHEIYAVASRHFGTNLATGYPYSAALPDTIQLIRWPWLSLGSSPALEHSTLPGTHRYGRPCIRVRAYLTEFETAAF